MISLPTSAGCDSITTWLEGSVIVFAFEIQSLNDYCTESLTEA
jgi:hypothetical protein